MADVRDQPALSAHGLVEFMPSGFYAREGILRRYKYTYPGQKVFAPYYQATMAAIRAYHRAGNDPAVFAAGIARLEGLLRTERNPRIQVRLRENVRAITSYQEHFGGRRFEVPIQVRVPSLVVGGVTLTCNPDIQVVEDGRRLLLCVHCGVTEPEKEAAACLTQLVHAAYQKIEPVQARYVRLIHLQSGMEVPWTGRGKKRWPQIQAACRQISALWPHI